MSTSADIGKASAALQSLKANPEVLKELDLALAKFRHNFEDIDDATYTYVLNSLLNQRVQDGNDSFGGVEGVAHLPGRFRILGSTNVAL